MASIDAKLLALVEKLNQLKEKVDSGVQEALQKASVVEKQEGPPGKDGKDGRDGVNGRDGRDGKDGKDGKDGLDGKDGISVVDATLDFDNSLTLKLSDGSIIDAGSITLNTIQGDGGQTYIKTSATPDVYAVQYDEVSSTTAYRGEAMPGTSASSSGWRIQKIVITNGEDVAITWAEGEVAFNKLWSNRLTYTYY